MDGLLALNGDGQKEGANKASGAKHPVWEADRRH